MTDPLFVEIDKFDQWAQSEYTIPQDEIGGDWECGYVGWTVIRTAFEKFMGSSNPNQWSDAVKERLLYIIARDNEAGYLASILSEPAIIVLTSYAIEHGHENDKWQLAVQLHKLSDRSLAEKLIETLANDEDEYVNRRALKELAKIQPAKVEHYAALFWNRGTYRHNGMDEYQRMAVLDALNTAGSALLAQYIELAKQDGRRYLVGIALGITGE